MGRDTDADHPHDLGDEARGYPAVPLLVPAAARRWRQVFSGEERQLGLMRRWLAACLPECPARDDVVSVATELGSNAILHTASGRGGWFAVELTWDQSTVRVAVADHGGPAEPHMIEDPDGEHGRGLLLVHGLSARTGVTGNEQGRIVWAEIAWDGPAPDADLAAAGPGEAEIRDGEAALARRFAGVPVWFGRATRAWWALAGPSDLVTAPTAPELAALLYRRLNTPPRPRAAGSGWLPPGSRPKARTGCLCVGSGCGYPPRPGPSCRLPPRRRRQGWWTATLSSSEPGVAIGYVATFRRPAQYVSAEPRRMRVPPRASPGHIRARAAAVALTPSSADPGRVIHVRNGPARMTL